MKITSDSQGEYYLVDERTRTNLNDLAKLIENNIEPTILDDYEYVLKIDGDSGLIIPKGYKVYKAEEIWLDSLTLSDFVSEIEDVNLYIKYPLLVHYSSTGTWWLAGSTDFDTYKKLMRDIQFRYSKSEPAFVDVGNESYIGILKPGLSILDSAFEEQVDLYPELLEEEPIYRTDLPVEDVLKVRSLPYPLYLNETKDGAYISLIVGHADKIVWISGIVPYPKSTNTILDIIQDLEPYIVEEPHNPWIYTPDTDIFYE